MQLSLSLPFPTSCIFPDNLVNSSPSVTARLICCCRQGAASGDGEGEPRVYPVPLSGTGTSEPNSEQMSESQHQAGAVSARVWNGLVESLR